MDIENQEVSFCADDGEYRVYCDICNKLCIEIYYKNHLKSQLHTNIIHIRQQLTESFQIISLNQIKDILCKVCD